MTIHYIINSLKLKIMKNSIKMAFCSVAMLLLGTLLFVACEKYDDSQLSGRVNGLETRVDKLEKLIADLNTNVASMTKLVKAFQEESRIERIEQIEGGYKIILADGKGEMTIKNGEKPVIGVEIDESTGVCYWTVDGKRMLVDGKEVPATMTPEIKVEGGSFWFRVNGGEWAKVAGSDSGVGLIKNVVESEESVTFVLSEGGEIVIPKVQTFRLNIETSESGIMPNSSVNIPYTITAGDAATKVVAFVGDGLTAKVLGDSQTGSITVTAQETVPEKTDMVVMAVNGKGVQSSKVITIEQGVFKAAKDTYTIGAQGGNIDVVVETNVSFQVMTDPDPANSWLKYVPASKAAHEEHITLAAEEYVGGTAPRTASITILYGSEMKKIMVTQLHTTLIDGGKADFENFSTEPGRVTAAISDATTGGWKMTNGYLRKATAVTPNAESKFPALYGRTNLTGSLTSPILKGGCGILTVALAGSKLPSYLLKGIVVNVEIKQNEGVVKSFSLSIKPEEYAQKKQFICTEEVNVAGEFQIVITNACPLQTTGTNSSMDDAFIPSVSWTGYSE